MKASIQVRVIRLSVGPITGVRSSLYLCVCVLWILVEEVVVMYVLFEDPVTIPIQKHGVHGHIHERMHHGHGHQKEQSFASLILT